MADMVLLCSFIQKYIAELKHHPREYSYSTVHSSSPDDSRTSSPQPKHGDRFVVHVPYCKGYLRWEVVFNMYFPDQPPDIILDEDAEWFDLGNCPTLANWTASSSFAAVLDEVLAQYREHHEESVRNHPNERLRYEYNTICGIAGVEYYVKSPCVRLMIPLNVDLAPVFHLLLNSKGVNEKCHYFVEFKTGDGGLLQVTHAELHWPTPLVPFPWLVDHPFPSFTLDRGGCLVQFVPELETSINEVINTRLNRHSRRRELCEALIAIFGHPLEYDAQHYSSIAFLFDARVAFVMHVFMSDGSASYPKDPPAVQLSSMGALEIADGKAVPVRCRMQRLNFDPGMTATQVSQGIRTELTSMLPEFLDICESFMPRPLV